MNLLTAQLSGYSVFDILKAEADEDIRSEDDEFNPKYEELYGEPSLHCLQSQYFPNFIPSYFKHDHPDDDSFMDIVGKSQVSISLGEGEPKFGEIMTLTKRVTIDLIWEQTRNKKYIWNNKEMEDLYIPIIEAAVCVVYFCYHQNDLFRIGRGHSLNHELEEIEDRLVDEIKDRTKEDFPFNEVCTLINQLISRGDNKYLLVTEDIISNMICHYPYTYPRIKDPTLSYDPVVAEKDKDKLYKDIAGVVQDLKPPQLEPDEYTHWMMTFLKGNAADVEFNIVWKILDDRNKSPIERHIHLKLLPLLHYLLNMAKNRLKTKLLEAEMPLIRICQPNSHWMSRVTIEIVEVAELRRIALGNQFIGRSHLIWAFYKLGYSLPLEIRNCIRIDVPDESHPPYHIYMAAAKLAQMSGEKCAKLVHFIYAVIHSQDIGLDGQGVTELYVDFRLFEEALEEMENEIKPKDTVTVRPCRAVDAIIQEMRERYYNCCEVEACLSLIRAQDRCNTCFLPPSVKSVTTVWFVKLRKFLIETNCFKSIVIDLDNFKRIDIDEDLLKNIVVISGSPYKLRELKLRETNDCFFTQSSHTTFLDALFWSCNPDVLTISFQNMPPGDILGYFKRKVQCWKLPLKKIEVEGVDCSSLLSEPSVLEFRFRLSWLSVES